MKKFIMVITLLLALVLFSVTAIEPVPFFGEVVTVSSVSTFDNAVSVDIAMLTQPSMATITNDNILLAESSVLTGQMIDQLLIGVLLSVILAICVMYRKPVFGQFNRFINGNTGSSVITVKGCVMPEGKVA